MDVQGVQSQQREERANEVIAAYLAAVEVGEDPIPQQWLARYPEVAEELASFFAAKEGFERQAGPLLPTATGPRELGDYVLLEEVARGGMGIVYRAWQKSLGRQVAVKTIRSGQLASAEDLRRFRAEAELAAGLDHPAIVPIYEVGEQHGQHFFSMRLIEGESLGQLLLGRSWQTGSREGQRRAAGLLAEVARAVHHAHQRGVLHRDLKPSNILLDADGRPHISDFGLARRIVTPEDASASGLPLTHSHAVVGTASYMAPEQAAGRTRQLTTAADVYSLGAILYELLTGRPPFRDENVLATLRAVQEQEPTAPRAYAEVDADLETICLKCLHKEPQRRYGSAEALADDLERWLDGEPIEARPAGPMERLAKWRRRRPGVALLTAAVVLVSVLGVAGMAWQWRDARAEERKALQAQQDAVSEAERAESARRDAVAEAHKAHNAQQAESTARKAALRERDRTAAALKRAEGLHLTAHASIVLPTDPTLALLLAVEGVKRAPGLLAHNTLRAALEACREERPPAYAFQDGTPAMLAGVSADGRRVLLAARDSRRLEVQEAHGGKLLCTVLIPGLDQQPVWSALSPDGKWVAAVRRGGSDLDFRRDGVVKRVTYTDTAVRLWDVDAGRQAAVLKGHDGGIGHLTFSPDSRLLLVASHDRSARLWDVRTAKQVVVMKGLSTCPRKVVFSPDGRTLLTLASGVTEQIRYSAAEVMDPPEVLGTDAAWLKQNDAAWRNTPSTSGGRTRSLAGPPQLWDTATGKEIATLARPFETALFNISTAVDAAFSPDGRRIVVIYKGTRVKARVWEAGTGKLLHTCRDDEPLEGRTTLAISPDCRQVLTALDRTAALEPLEEGGKTQVVGGHTDRVVAGQFSADGRRIVTSSKDGSVRVWDARTGEEVQVLRVGQPPQQNLRFSADSRHLLSDDWGDTHAWSLDPQPAHVRVLRGHKGWVSCLDFSPDGSRLVSGGEDGTARIYHVATGLLLARYCPPSAGDLLRREALSDLRVKSLLEMVEDMPRGSWGPDSVGQVLSLQFAPNGKRILFLSREERLQVESEPGKPPRTLPFHPARILDAATGKQLLGLAVEDVEILGARFSRDGKRVVVVESGFGATGFLFTARGAEQHQSGDIKPSPFVRVFDASSGAAVCSFRRGGMVLSADFTPDDSRVVTSDGRGVCVWDNAAGKKGQQQRPLAEYSAEGPIALSPDGRRALNRNPPLILDLATGKEVCRLQGDLYPAVFSWPNAGGFRTAYNLDLSKPAEGPLRVSPFSPDGRWLVGPLYDDLQHTVGVWDASTGKLVHRLRGHEGTVLLARFSPDGRSIATVGEDHTARVWDAATGKEMHTLRGHQGAVLFTAFSPDGKRLATAGADGSVRVWELDLLDLARRRSPRQLTPEERQRYEVSPASEEEAGKD